MSQEKVFKTLESLGLSKPDAQVYIFLGKKGPQKGKDIAKALKMPKQRLYLVLKNLQSKGIVNATLEHPAKFSALPFEKALDLFVKAKMEEAHRIDGDKNEILSDWQSIAISETGDQSPKFTVLEGRNYIYPRLKQMIEDTKSQLSIISTVPGLVSADQFGLLEAAFNHAAKTKTKFRFLTEVSKENLKAAKMLLEKMPKRIANVEGRTPELDFKLISRMLIRDDVEAAFFVGQEVNKTAKDNDEVCLWTNSNSIVNSFKAVFEDLWHNSANFESRVAEIETGKPTAKTYIMTDPEASRKKYGDVMASAKKEIFIVTSAEGLVEAWKNDAGLRAKTEKGVSIKIMAPITCENLEFAMKLIGICEVRNGPPGWLITTIIDNKILFQAKTYKNEEIGENQALFYSSDPAYVETTINMINKLWKNARVPSHRTLKSILDNTNNFERTYRKKLIGEVVYEAPPGKIKESDILNKIFAGKKYPTPKGLSDIVKYYGSSAIGIVYPPEYFQLPELLFNVLKCNKQSSFGVEDWLIISLKTETKEGSKYIPVVYVTDNPRAAKFRTAFFTNSSQSKSVQVMKEHELQVHVQGNSLFAGWTTPIALPILESSIPPAALLFEGYGNITSGAVTRINQFGRIQEVEFNRMEARFTFFHPSSNYSGPGIDGFFDREMIFTSYPKEKSVD